MNATDHSSPPPSAGSRLRWPLVVAGLLGAHVSTMALAVHVASGDPGSGNGNHVLPDYYERAVRWDEARNSARRTQALGWQVSPSVSAFTAAQGMRELSVAVTDRTGTPVDALALQARIWHHAVGHQAQLALVPVAGAPGLYSAMAPMDRPGTWEVELVDRQEGGVFDHRTRLEVASFKAAAGPLER